MKTTILLLAATVAWGGQSIRLSTTSAGNSSIPAQSASNSFRVEINLHDWGAAVSGHPYDVPAVGLDVQWLNVGDLRLQLYGSREVGGSVCQIATNTLPSEFLTVRFQHDAVNKVDYCQAWDVNGTRVANGSTTFTSVTGSNSNGATVQPTGVAQSTGYFRIYTTLVATNARPPVTAEPTTGCLVYWKFDLGNNTGSLTDACSAGPYNATMSSGSPTYVATPGQTLVVPILKTSNAPSWGTWISMKVGASNGLDGSSSYSQADASATVTCAWSSLSGPTTPTFSNAAICSPTLTNVAFGDYNLQLVATDAAANTATATQHIGAVDYDGNGVVVQSDPNVTTIYGPMIAFGQNPWGWMDERNYAMIGLQQTYMDGGAWTASQSWMTAGTGTVAYTPAGIGPAPGAAGTALGVGGITSATSTSIPVSDASKLDLSALPTWIVVGNSYGGPTSSSPSNGQEIIRVCSTTGTSGAQTLTACYDGRGIAGTTGQYRVAQSWPAGTTVGQYRIKGTSTLFATDANSPLCPAGVPGPPGRVTYSTGTVTMSASSTTLTGSGTSWAVGATLQAGWMVRVAATHATGTSFVFWAEIVSVTDTTHIVMSRAAPSDIDGTAFNYKIVATRYASLGFVAPDGGSQNGWQYLHGCESETSAFGGVTHDVTGLNTVAQTGQTYSYIDGFGAQSAFGPNFYGTGLALRAFYYRSGLQQALDLANRMDDYWVKDPEIAGGWFGGIPLLQGGAVIGAIANKVLNGSSLLNWSDVEQFGVTGEIGALGCDAYDSRDSGYLEAWTTLLAMFEPDATKKAAYRTALQAINTRENTCRTQGRTALAVETNSWANGATFNTSSPAMTLTNGSATVTGTGFTSGLCFGIASGTVSVTSGSAAFTGTGLVNGSKIVITGTRSGQPFVGFYQFTQSGGTSGTLAALWPGDTGSATYVIENSDYLTTIGTSSADSNIAKSWACTYVSSTQLTLNRAWDGSTGSSYHMYSYVLAGYDQQPYMLGIKTTMFNWASTLDATLSTNFGTLAGQAAGWVKDYGYDGTVTKGMFYGRVLQACEPVTTPPIGSTFTARTPGCNNGDDPASIIAARTLSGETSSSFRAYYLASPSTTTWQDEAYGAVWCATGYQTNLSLPCDTAGAGDNVGASNQSDAYLGSFKWPGLFFGMGMAHQWPAVRVSGSTPASSTVLRVPRLRGVVIR